MQIGDWRALQARSSELLVAMADCDKIRFELKQLLAILLEVAKLRQQLALAMGEPAQGPALDRNQPMQLNAGSPSPSPSTG